VTVDPVLREIGQQDRGELVAIDEAAREGVAAQRGGSAWLAGHPALARRWSPDADAPLGWVALIDDVIVGFLLLDIVSLAERGSVAMVDRVFVVAEARELGCGDALLAVAEGAARTRGCVALEGIALPGDRETKNLYERAGVVARSITVSKNL